MYEIKNFNIPKLKGISEKTIEEHIKLYEGYVKNTNLILDKIRELKDDQNNSYLLSETQRRFSFEFNGMKNHELYFSHFEGGFREISNGNLKNMIEKEWGSFNSWLERFKVIAKTRGIGWATLSYDKSSKKLLNNWIDEQHLGQLLETAPILMIDMWEHSFVHDYLPSGKSQYIDDFFENINWENIEEKFNNMS